MQQPSTEFVYHGSHESFDIAIPKLQRRKSKNKETGEWETVFEDVSFHATPYKWIALNYICQCQNVSYQGKRTGICTGVSLKSYKEEIEVYGVESLEKSLEFSLWARWVPADVRCKRFCYSRGAWRT
jgi:hypothetical protein